MNKIYNLTGINGSESINIMSTSNNGRELIICSDALHGICAGDTLLLDRPYHKKVPFRIEGVRYLPEQPNYSMIYAKLIDAHVGGSKKSLRLRFKRSK